MNEEIEHKNRTAEEAKEYYGERTWNFMKQSKLLDGCTGLIKQGKFVFYGVDLENAYNFVKTGKVGFID